MASEATDSQAGDDNPAAYPGLDVYMSSSMLGEESKITTSEEA